MGRQAHRRKMRDDAVGVGLGNQPAPGRKLERERHAEPDRLAVQQPVGEAGRGLEGMAEGVAEIEQHAVAGLALVARDDRGLGAAAHRDGVLARKTSGRSPPANRSRQLASSHSKKLASPSNPYFTTSA